MIIIQHNELRGKAHTFGDDINTDYIIPGKYLMNVLDPQELATHVMEGVQRDFYEDVKAGDFIVAGTNFGCGSSREEAPTVIKDAGIGAVLAKSFARIFYRNAINIGLPILQCNTEPITAGQELTVDLSEGTVKDSDGQALDVDASPLPQAMMEILTDGGLVPHLSKHGSFDI